MDGKTNFDLGGNLPQIVMITGATAGIGKATAARFAAEGWWILATGRRVERLEAIKKELEDKFRVKVETIQADVKDYTKMEKAIEHLPDEWKNIRVLVNNAGLALGRDTIQHSLVEDWDTMIDTNIKGLLYVSKIVIPYLQKHPKGGHIINLGSIAGKEVYANGAVYCATKFAVDALSRGMRIDLLHHGVKVTAIHPGLVETEFSEVRFKGNQQKAKLVYEGYQPLFPEDVADAIFYAASRPHHVNIGEITLTPLAQASAHYLYKG